MKEKMFFMGFNEDVRAVFNKDTNKFLVYSHILFNTNYSQANYNGLNRNQCYTSVRVIMDSTGLKRDMVNRKLNELVKDGFIDYAFKSTNKHEPSKINVYWNDELRSAKEVKEQVITKDVAINISNEDLFLVEYMERFPNQVTSEIVDMIQSICNKMDIELFKFILMEIFANKRIKNHYEYFYKTLKATITKDLMTINAYRIDKEQYNQKNFKEPKKATGEVKVTTKKNGFRNFNETYTQYEETELNDIIEKSQREKFGESKNEHKKSISDFGEDDIPFS